MNKLLCKWLWMLLLVLTPLSGLMAQEEEEEINRFFKEKDWISLRQGLIDPSSVKKLYIVNEASLDLASLDKFTHVQGLIIHDTPITDLAFLSKFKALKILELNTNGLKTLDGVEKLDSLEELAIDHNFVSSLEPLRGLNRLRELRFYENQVSDLAPIAHLTRLTHLDAGKNRITSIEPIRNCTALKVLSLYRNTTVESLEYIRNFRQLCDLNISLMDKPDFSLEILSQMTELKNLRVQNMVKSNDELVYIRNLRKMQQLTMGINDAVTDISMLDNYPELEYLDIHSNNVTDISVIRNYPNLMKLVMYRNKIQDITPLKDTPKILAVFMFENPVSSYDTVLTMTQLEFLHVSKKDFDTQAMARLRSALKKTKISFI